MDVEQDDIAHRTAEKLCEKPGKSPVFLTHTARLTAAKTEKDQHAQLGAVRKAA